MRYVIPIAAEDDLFPRSEFHFPKPLIEVDGEPMIARVIANILEADPRADFIFVVKAADCREFSLDQSLLLATDGACTIVPLSQPTAGAACSALLAIEHIDDEEPIVLCNGDQIIEQEIGMALQYFQSNDADAGIITFSSVHPRWSYVRSDENGAIIEAAEKRVISKNAIAGFYYFRTGSSFIRAAQSAILNERSHGGHYYIAPTLNELVLDGARIIGYNIAADRYQSLFSPHRIENYERRLQSQRSTQPAAISGITIVIPMAGLGSRFVEHGYKRPKPFIDVAGKSMIERVMDNLGIPGARFLLVARAEHIAQEPQVVAGLLARGDVEFVSIDAVTAGAACTVLAARKFWDEKSRLLIANCDQIVDFDCSAFINDAISRELDGSILVFDEPGRDPKWSYAKAGHDGLVTEVREKVAISSLATVGIYYFGTAKAFEDAAVDMIARTERVNNEFYVCPVYNYALDLGAKVGVFEIPAESMHGIGTPPDLEGFLRLRYSH